MSGPRPAGIPCKHSTSATPICEACARNRARVALWHAVNPGRATIRANRSQARAPERKRAVRTAYANRNRSTIRARAGERCALDRGASYSTGPIPLADVYRADDGTCALCLGHVPAPGTVPPNHAEAPTVDHVRPVRDGGAHALDNVRLAHRSCNSRRGRTPFVPGMYAPRIPEAETVAPF